MTAHKWNSRTELLLGSENISRLQSANILIVGLGGVGAYAAEELCRAGVGRMTIVDADCVDVTNINRQLPALHTTVNVPKSEILAKRFKDINPDAQITSVHDFLKDEKIPAIIQSENFDFVVDAIDSLSPKTHLILNAVKAGIKVVSSMGAGGKIDPSKVQIADISKTYNCGLARALRKKLHRAGVYKGIDTVFSPEERKSISIQDSTGTVSNTIVGTISYMPAIFGCFCASIVINKIVNEFDE